jgi:DNA-binding MarR family transcriptional regulator
MENLRKGGFLITKIRKYSSRIFSKLLEDYKINEVTAAQGRVLFPLWFENKLSFQDLKQKTALSKATLSHMLDKLEDSGYVKRVRSEKDRRVINIELIDMNDELKQKFIQVSDEMKEIYYKGFTDKEMDEFENYLQKLLDNLISYTRK